MLTICTIKFVTGHVCYDTAAPLYARAIFLSQYQTLSQDTQRCKNAVILQSTTGAE